MIIPGKGHKKDDVISLLQCLVELCEFPEHTEALCGTNDCSRCNYDAYKAELEAPCVRGGADLRMFPMLEEPRHVPWDFGIAIWEHLYNPLNGDQSAARVAERGGFGWDELRGLARDWKRRLAKI